MKNNLVSTLATSTTVIKDITKSFCSGLVKNRFNIIITMAVASALFICSGIKKMIDHMSEIRSIAKKRCNSCNLHVVSINNKEEFNKVSKLALEYWGVDLNKYCETSHKGNLFICTKKGCAAYAKAHIAFSGETPHPVYKLRSEYDNMLYIDLTDARCLSLSKIGQPFGKIVLGAAIIDKNKLKDYLIKQARDEYGPDSKIFTVRRESLESLLEKIKEDKKDFIKKSKEEFGDDVIIDEKAFKYTIAGEAESTVYITCLKDLLYKYSEESLQQIH